MSIREKLNDNSKVVAIGAAALIVILLIWVFLPAGGGGEVAVATNAYFSDDDGKTFFTDDASKVTPFNHNGREAVSAVVFQCGDGKRFVGYLERAAGEQQKATIAKLRKEIVTRAATQPSGMPDSELILQITQNTEVKRPGDPKWANAADTAAGTVFAVKCADNSVPQKVAP